MEKLKNYLGSLMYLKRETNYQGSFMVIHWVHILWLTMMVDPVIKKDHQ